MMHFITKRVCIGCYYVKVRGVPDAIVQVSIDRIYVGTYRGCWIARANWDSFTLTDPVRTKAEAVEAAKSMLAEEVTARYPIKFQAP